MNKPLSDKSWQYRQLNAVTPGLDALSDALLELVALGEPIVAGTADLQYSNGLSKFHRLHPERFVQFGISEQNMVSAAAGMAAVGMKPYVATFASFLALLCCEQIRMDVAYSRLPVRLIGHHAGISLGFYGTSHHATEDLAIARSIANLTVVAPADGNQLMEVIKASNDYPDPIYIRIQRGRDPVVHPQRLPLRSARPSNTSRERTSRSSRPAPPSIRVWKPRRPSGRKGTALASSTWQLSSRSTGSDPERRRPVQTHSDR